MRVAIIGTGYVGLVSSAGLAAHGHDVVGVDIDSGRIERLQAGSREIFEPGLDEFLTRAHTAGSLGFTTDYEAAVPNADVVLIAVGTPNLNGSADLNAVEAAIRSVARHLTPGTVVGIKSTVPVGSTARMAAVIRSQRPDVEFDMVSNPEFLRQGSAVADFEQPDRLVIGSESERAAEIMGRLYGWLVDNGTPSLFTTIQTAELIKYASNSFLAIKLSYVNEIADLCELAGANIEDVTYAIGLDPRIGSSYLSSGPGYGGSCLPKDTQALLHTSRVYGAPSRLVAAAVDVNADRKLSMPAKIADALDGAVAGKTIGILGVTFKANTDDLRESPAVDIIRWLVGHDAKVRLYDPEGMDNAQRLIGGIEYAEDAYAALDGADACVILTEWAEFGELDLARVRSTLANPLIVDLRNMYRADVVRDAGLRYVSVGRPTTD